MKFSHAVKYNGVYYPPNAEIPEAPTAEATAPAKETTPVEEKTAPKAKTKEK